MSKDIFTPKRKNYIEVGEIFLDGNHSSMATTFIKRRVHTDCTEFINLFK